MSARWRKSLHQAATLVPAGGRVLLGASAALPQALLAQVRDCPDLWQGVTLTGAFVPGVNDEDLSTVGTGTRVETIFATPGLMAAEPGRVSHLPLHYTAFWNRLARPGMIDCVIVTVPPPRDDGTVGLGVTADFAPAAIAAGARLIGVINTDMPDVAQGPRLPKDRFAALAEGSTPLTCYDPGPPDDVFRAIAAHVVGLLRPGDTLQLGLGKLQQAVLLALEDADLPGLGFHGGMISGPMVPLIDAGLFPGGVTAGVGLGPDGFAREVARLPGVRFAPVGETHFPARLAALPGLLSVNSCLEIDLSGQANGETLGGRQISGQGGLVDFMRGARLSSGGRSVLALPSRAGRSRHSRIVAALSLGSVVSVSRADVDHVVTEYGIADLREASVHERAARLVAIAAPEQRDNLWNSWEALQRTG